jgi:hypothetical protein
MAMKLADKAVSMEEQAKEAERQAEAIDRAMNPGEDTSGEEQVSSKPRPTSSELCKILKGIELMPRSGKRTDIARTTAALDDLKSAGTLQLWDSSTQVGAQISSSCLVLSCLGLAWLGLAWLLSAAHVFRPRFPSIFQGVCCASLFPSGMQECLNTEP